MDALARPALLRVHLFALLGLSGLACDADKGADTNPKADKGAPEVTSGAAPDATTAVAPASTSAPDETEPPPPPPEQGTDHSKTEAGSEAEPEAEAPLFAPNPEGANFCFAAAEVGELALPESKVDEASGCALALEPGAVRKRVDNWSRRTGGPWDIRVTFHASDTPEGGGQRCCYVQAFSRVPGTRPTRGRPLLVAEPGGERLLVPEANAAVHSTERAAWLRDAQVEHASIAAFARANLELMAHGGPASLIRANLAAAREEIVHAQLCLERAGVTELGPLEPTPARDLERVDLAARTLIEACIPETLGALAAARAAARARDEGDRDTAALRSTIAGDEAGHAALAWATLGWLADREGELGTKLARFEARIRESFAEVLAAEPELDADEGESLWRELIEPLVQAVV